MIVTSDYELVTESAGLVDRYDRAKFLVRGGEAADFLQGQVSNDVEALEPGQGQYATVLSHKGKLRTDLRILRGDDWFWLDTESIGHAVLEHMLRTYSLGRDVQYEDVTETRALLSLVGPAARERLDAAPPAEENSFVTGEHGIYVATLLGVDVICEPGTTLDVEPVSEEVAECVRIEAGRPRLGYDMDADTMPQEAGINERAVSFSKGCYVGQETVARLHYRGKPNRHLRGLRLSSRPSAAPRSRSTARWSAGSGPPASPPGSARSRSRSSAARRSRAPRWTWAERRPRSPVYRCSLAEPRRPTSRHGLSADSPLLGHGPQGAEGYDHQTGVLDLPAPPPRGAGRPPRAARLGPPPSRAARSTTGAARSASSTSSSRCSTSTTATGSAWRSRAPRTCRRTAAR